MSLSAAKEFLDVIQAVITIAAIVIGGFWGYILFNQNRQRYPRASISHHVTHKPIADGKLLLHVTVIITNLSNVLLSLVTLEIRIQRILPVPKKILETIAQGLDPVLPGHLEIGWPIITSRELRPKKGEYEVEPGESQEIHCDFIVSSEVQTIEIYSYLKNQTKWGREIGWDSTTLYDFKESEG